jgi:hypothetical protein
MANCRRYLTNRFDIYLVLFVSSLRAAIAFARRLGGGKRQKIA